MKRIWNSVWTMFFISIGLYSVGHVIEEPLLMWKYEVYKGGYLIDTGGSVLPLLIGSLFAYIIAKK